jgi:putative oxidoreductase
MLSGRVLMPVIFMPAGTGKTGACTGTQGYIESMGVPVTLLPLVIALEVGAGIAVLVGWQTCISGFLLAGFSVLGALIFHADFGDQMQSILFMKNLAMAGGLLLLVANGAGDWSVDARQRRTSGGLQHA